VYDPTQPPPYLRACTHSTHQGKKWGEDWKGEGRRGDVGRKRKRGGGNGRRCGNGMKGKVGGGKVREKEETEGRLE